MSKFNEILDKLKGNKVLPKLLLCLDPGETTGWCYFADGKLISAGQIETVVNDELIWVNLTKLIDSIKPSHIVCEDYRIYQHKLERHSFSPVLTLRLIGAIDYMAYVRGIYIHYQMATQAKGFVTDEKLKDWGFWQPSMKHSRDAIRHGCYSLLFNKKWEVPS